MDRIGLVGGTFDPPHLGHLWLAENGRESLGLARVLFLPVGRPPHRRAAPVATAEERLAMMELAMGGEPAFEVSDLDVRRPEPHYTATLLPPLRERFPAAELWLLMGSDSLRDLTTWRRPQVILATVRLGVLPRPGVVIDWANLSGWLPGIDGRVSFLPGPALDISGREIRARLAAGRSARYLLPPAVGDYVRANRLYAAARTTGR